MSEELTITAVDGLALEAVLDEAGDPGALAVVLCHPHPRMGGTMKAPLLLALRDELVGRGWPVLRFNFRGVGASAGTAGTGIDEVSDALGALVWARRRFPGAAVALAGWSFGAAVALRAAALAPEVAAVVAIAPAVTERPGITAGLPPAQELALVRPLLVVAAANDKLSPPAECERWAKAAGARYEVVAGANHFFWARYEQLATLVTGFLAGIQGGGKA
jgi:alpha/beta superfamily hydrolase